MQRDVKVGNQIFSDQSEAASLPALQTPPPKKGGLAQTVNDWRDYCTGCPSSQRRRLGQKESRWPIAKTLLCFGLLGSGAYLLKRALPTCYNCNDGLIKRGVPALPTASKDSASLAQTLARVAYRGQSTFSPSTVIMLSANYGYLPFVANWACKADALNLRYMVLSMDVKLHNHLQRFTRIPSIDGQSLAIGALTSFSQHATVAFNAITVAKFKGVVEVLKHNYNVFFTDADTALYDNPLPSLRHDVDLECQAELLPDSVPLRSECNTGVYFAKANSRTTSLFSRAIDLVAERNLTLNDQEALNALLDSMDEKKEAFYVPLRSQAPQGQPGLTHRHLPVLAFPNGHVRFLPDFLLWSSISGDSQTLVHYTSLVGAKSKMQKMHEHGAWRLVKQNESCAGTTDCFGQTDNAEWLRCATDGEKVPVWSD